MVDLGGHADVKPFAYFETYELVVTSASADRQLMRAPWPKGMYADLISVRVTNVVGSGGQVVMWDQDLSNSTPTIRGSPGQAIAIFPIGGAAFSGQQGTTATYDAGPTSRFYGGVALQASAGLINAHIAGTFRIRR